MTHRRNRLPSQGRHLREAGGDVAPRKEKEKKKKERKKRKKRKKKERKKEGNYKKRQITSYKVLFFFKFFNCPVALKNKKKIWPPKKKLK